MQEGNQVSQAVFFSPTLDLCVGMIEIINGTQNDHLVFNAETGWALGAIETMMALDDWSSQLT